ncbi:MAG: hypothetical protein IKJ86_04975, partial [Clostridia bacterium]|nr:hypothetical protein [Clostridia bacterium]
TFSLNELKIKNEELRVSEGFALIIIIYQLKGHHPVIFSLRKSLNERMIFIIFLTTDLLTH